MTCNDYVANWHHATIADHLERVESGEITRLIVTMPPRHGKSQLATRCLPAWYLGRNPSKEVVVSAYSASLANDFCRDFRRICDSPEYKLIFPGTKLPTGKDKGWINKADEIEIVDHGGSFLAAGVGGSLTGRGADLAIIDDPIKNRDEAYSPTYRERVWGWYETTLSTRLQGDKAGIVIIMTRWHQDDLVGRLLRIAAEDPEAEQWIVLELPALKESEPNDVDPRDLGDALWPDRYNESFLATRRATIGGAAWESLYQCKPTSAAGEIVQRNWLNTYGDEWQQCQDIIQAWDLNFGKKAESVKSSYVSGQCWGRIGANYYLLEAVRGRWTHTENKHQVRMMRERWSRCRAVYVEDAASGAPLIDDLKGVVPGLIPVKPRGSKVTRFESVAPLFEAGQVFVPSIQYPWLKEWIEEIVSYPGSPNNDQVDACAMALAQLTNRIDYTKFRAPTGGHRVPKRMT